MHGLTRLARGLAAVAALVAVTAAVPATPASASELPTCTTAIWAPIDVPVQRLLPVYASGFDCSLEIGVYNNFGVVALHETLRTCYGQPIDRDGDFGPDTEDALRVAEYWEKTANGKEIGVNGIYDVATRKALVWPYFKDGVYKGCK